MHSHVSVEQLLQYVERLVTVYLSLFAYNTNENPDNDWLVSQLNRYERVSELQHNVSDGMLQHVVGLVDVYSNVRRNDDTNANSICDGNVCTFSYGYERCSSVYGYVSVE